MKLPELKIEDELHTKLVDLVSPTAWVLFAKLTDGSQIQGVQAEDMVELRMLARAIVKHPNFDDLMKKILKERQNA